MTRKEEVRPVGTRGAGAHRSAGGVAVFPASLRDVTQFFLAYQGLEVPGYYPVAPPGQGSATLKNVGKGKGVSPELGVLFWTQG